MTDKQFTDDPLIAVLNFGSTSTKVGVYRGDEREFVDTIRYEPDELARFETIFDQVPLREEGIVELLKDAGYDSEGFDAVVSRGPICKPIGGGTYAVSKQMIEDGKNIGGHHPCVLGPIVARKAGRALGIPAYTVDPPTVDQLEPVARISGLPEYERIPIWQPLNHRQIGRTWAKENGTTYEESNLIIAHMGGGTSIAAHRHGRAIDVNNGTEGEGAMTPERPGTIPLCPIIEMCFSGEYSREQILRKVRHGAGVLGYLGTADMKEVERRANEGDDLARLVLDALCYQVSKEIGALYAVLECQCDAILLTGGLAYSEYVTGYISRCVGGMAPVFVFPGEDEIGALAQGTLRVMRGEEELQEY